jgi:hypothetical protein
MIHASRIYFHVTATDAADSKAQARHSLGQADIAAEPHRTSLTPPTNLKLATRQDLNQPVNTITHLYDNQQWTPKDSSASPSRNG